MLMCADDPNYLLALCKSQRSAFMLFLGLRSDQCNRGITFDDAVSIGIPEDILQDANSHGDLGFAGILERVDEDLDLSGSDSA